MSNPWDDMRAALAQSESTLRAADDCANSMASMLLGRLRKISPYRLKELKRELQDFDASRRQWKTRK